MFRGDPPVVLNVKKVGKPSDAVFVGRPSKFGNPFSIGPHGSRTQVLEKYRRYLSHRPDLMAAARAELQGRDLLCFCAPLPCHADLLLKIANGGLVLEPVPEDPPLTLVRD